jgi:tetratricopeptide (TPR) repeat protein
MKAKIIFVFVWIIFFTVNLGAQNSKLADQYYLEGEYEKAGVLYQQLYKNSNRSDYFFNKYIECLLALEEFEQSEKMISQQLKLSPQNVHLYVTLGNVLERQNRFEEADEIHKEAIKNLPADVGQITKLANAFLALTKYDLAIEAFERGHALIGNPGIFSYNLADLYRRKGESAKMVENYLYSVHVNPKRLPSIQSLLQRYLKAEDFGILQEQLYTLIQEYPEADHFPEMLAWSFIMKKDYKSALRQMKALDRRLEENGIRVFRLGKIAENAKSFETAIDAFDYIVDSKGNTSSYYLEAKRSSLANKRMKIIENYDYTTDELLTLEKEYISFLDEFGWNRITAKIITELADLEALYINDLDKAVELLTKVISYPGVNRIVLADAKLSLADFHLIRGDIWDASLLYSQVDKAFKEEILGQEARFRNAKLSYYNGDFEWAQAQFDILKASTSRFIANDALDLSIFILDNLGLDTTDHPLVMFAETELLIFQNRFNEAQEQLTILGNIYPDHGLQDDILYLKAQIFLKQRAYDQAALLYEQIITEYPEEIRADNAMYELAELNENQLKNPEKAKELYERLFIEYSGSTFSVEARKRFRILRGDFLEDPAVQ